MDKSRADIITSASELQGRAWIDAQYALEQKRILEVRKLRSAVTRQVSELPPEWDRRSGRSTHSRARKGLDKSRDPVAGLEHATMRESRRLKGRQVGPPGEPRTDSGRRRRLSYVLPVTGKPYGSAQANTWRSTAKKKRVLTLGRLRELRRIAKLQKPQPSIFEMREKYRVQKKSRELQKRYRNLRMQNLSRSLAAGAPVGEFLESLPSCPPSRAAKRYRKATPRMQWRRLPGSFETGKRR